MEIARGEGGGSRCAASPVHVLVATSRGHRRTGYSEALAGRLSHGAWRPVSLRGRWCVIVTRLHASERGAPSCIQGTVLLTACACTV